MDLNAVAWPHVSMLALDVSSRPIYKRIGYSCLGVVKLLDSLNLSCQHTASRNKRIVIAEVQGKYVYACVWGGVTENTGRENNGPSKSQGVKM